MQVLQAWTNRNKAARIAMVAAFVKWPAAA